MKRVALLALFLSITFLSSQVLAHDENFEDPQASFKGIMCFEGNNLADAVKKANKFIKDKGADLLDWEDTVIYKQNPKTFVCLRISTIR